MVKEDVFRTPVRKGVSNEADLASHYPYNAQRWRLYSGSATDSNRILPEYSSTSKYEHERLSSSTTAEKDVHKLLPNSDETLIFQTPELYRYVVGFEALITQAFSMGSSLQGDDRVRMGVFDGTDGYGIELTPGLGDSKARMFIMRNGKTEPTEEVNIRDYTSEYTRLQHRFAWYEVARYAFNMSYTVNNEQDFTTEDSISNDGLRAGPRQGNLPIRFEVRAGSGRSDQELVANFGSASWITLGDIEPNFRKKPGHIDTGTSGAIDAQNTWVPIAALKTDDNLDLINTQLTEIDIGEYTGSGDVRILAIACSPSKTDASGFSVPEETSEGSSTVRQTQSITKFPDDTGSMVQSTDSPGGFTIAKDKLYSASGNQTEARPTDTDLRPTIFARDQIVIIAKKTDGTDEDVKLDYATKQDW